MAPSLVSDGSSRGLGRAIVEAGLAAGNKVLATARDIESLHDLSERHGDQIKALRAGRDRRVRGSERSEGGDRQLWARWRLLLNNAGYGNLSSVEDTPMSDFRAQIETNLFGTIILTKAALPYFRPKESRSFCSVSFDGRQGSGLRAWALFRRRNGVSRVSQKCLSREVAPLGIKVTIVEPGGFRTDFAGSSTKLSEEIPTTTRLLEPPPGFNATTTVSSPVDPKKAAQAIVRLNAGNQKTSIATVARQRCVQRGGEKTTSHA